MSNTVKVHYLTLRSATSATVDLASLEAFAKPGNSVEFDHNAQPYLLDSPTWSARSKKFAAVIYRIRQHQLPKKISGTTVGDLPLKDKEFIGEPTCFAIDTKNGGVAVHYAHAGARHPSIKDALAAIGVPQALQLEPVLDPKVWQYLADSTRAVSIDFTIVEPDQVRKELAKQGTLSHAVGAAEAVGAATVTVSLSMGRTRGELNKPAVLSALRAALSLNSSSKKRVTSLHARAEVDGEIQPLDLLNARIADDVPVSEQGKHINTDQLCAALLSALSTREKEIGGKTA